MRPDTFLVLDQGGHASRALVYGRDGTLLAHARQTVTTRRPAPGRVEQDGDEIIASLESVLDEVVSRVAGDAVVGLAVQRSSVICWRRSTGEPLTPVLSWQDTRAHALFDGLGLSTERVTEITGLPASAHYGATKLAWLLRNVPAVEDAMFDGDLCLGPLASFITYRLLDGKPYFITPTLAQRMLLFDTRSVGWSPELLDAFGLPDALLPDLVPDTGARGTLRAARLDLRVCTGDQNAVPYVAGPPEAGTLYVNAGTGAFVLFPLAEDIGAPSGLLRSLLPAGGVAAEGTVNGAGSAVAWFEDQERASMPWADLDALRVPLAGAPLFLNTVGDLGSPFWRTGVPPRFDTDTGTRLERAYAVIESIAFLLRVNVAAMRESGARIGRVRLGGGLATSAAFRALTAATLGTPVECGFDQEMTARGVLTLLDARVHEAPATVTEPSTAWSTVLDDRYRRWRASLADA